jgi:hypothetical protein
MAGAMTLIENSYWTLRVDPTRPLLRVAGSSTPGHVSSVYVTIVASNALCNSTAFVKVVLQRYSIKA